MDILTNQYRKISTFFYILLLLYIVTIFSNLYFQWEGISIIVRIYLFIFSFQLVFIFSQIDLDPYRNIYIGKYGKNGELLLFFITRVIPLLVIYVTIVIFTFIFYLRNQNWPMRPFLNVLNGRFSNIIIYSLILMIILKIEKSLKITIPLFFTLGVLYFITYKIVYYYSPDGFPTSVLKIMNFAIVFFFIFFEFFYDKINLIKIALLTILLSLTLHFFVVGVYYSIFRYSKTGSYSQIKTSFFLLKMGYAFPLEKMNEIVENKSKYYLMPDIIYYTEKYNRDIHFPLEKWENLFENGSYNMGKAISGYLMLKNIKVSFESINRLAVRLSLISGKQLLETDNILKYAAKYYPEYRGNYLSFFRKENIFYKLWILKVIRESADRESVPWLIEQLTNIDREISETAYEVLKHITGLDPAAEMKIKVNNPAVISAFRNRSPQMDRDL